MSKPIRRAAVIGAGVMGSGIAAHFANAGIEVLLMDIVPPNLTDAEKGNRAARNRFAAGGLEKAVKARPAAFFSKERARLVTIGNVEDDLEKLKNVDLVIEAIIEQLPAKRELWTALDRICPKHTIFASNTSSLSITEMAMFTQRPDRFLGLHFFNPVPVMKLVEVIRTIATDPKVDEAAVALAARFGKTPVRTTDRTGFIVNRLLVPYLLDAVRALEEGVGSIEDIDNSMKLGCGHPMGPLTLLDFVGHDTTYYIANIMFDEFKEKRFAPPPLLKRMVLMGWNGRKAGRGFYDYSDPAKPKPLQFT